MNPFGYAYSNLDGVLEFAKPGGVIVTGRGNRMHSTFQQARAKGVELWAYWNCVEAPDNLKDPQDIWQFQLADGSHPPLWPGKDKNGKPRTQWPGNHLLDIRPGSGWLKHIIPRTGELCELHKHDGLMLDTMGAHPWSHTKTVNGVIVPGADWETWPVDEQMLWVTCMVSLARELAEEVAKHSPRLKLVHNNLWANVLPTTHPAYATAPNGEKYCNGLMLENPSGDVPSDFHKVQAGRTFGILPRRVAVVDRTKDQALAWSKVPGVTHIACVDQAAGQTYAKITPPVVPYGGPDGGEVVDDNLKLRERIAELTAQNAVISAQLNKTQADLSAVRADVERLNLKISRIDAQVHAP